MVFAAEKAALKTEIKARKKACFADLCQTANVNPWGVAFRIVLANTRGVMAIIEQSPEMLKGIIEELFPRHDPGLWAAFVGQPGTGAGVEERVSDVKLAGIANSLSVGKATSPLLQSLPRCSGLLCRNA